MTGDYYGHIYPGCVFLLTGLWWLGQTFRIKNTGEKRGHKVESRVQLLTRTWYPLELCGKDLPIEPLFKLVFCLTGIAIELGKSARFQLFDQSGKFIHLNDFSHATMYTFFCLQAMLEIVLFLRHAQPPKHTEHIFLAMAFVAEGFLFQFHLDQRTELDKRIHQFVYISAYLTAIAVSLEPCKRLHPWTFYSKVLLVLVQGTWFFQVGHTLYGTKPWDEHSQENILALPILFAWHALVWIFVIFFVNIAQSYCSNRHRREQHVDEEESIVLTSQLPNDALVNDED